MIEKEMGNRGSKLKNPPLFYATTSLLKEQRVDGSWQLLYGVDNPCLRFTLMGYESNSPKENGLFIEQRVSLINHQIKFLSNQINIWIKYSTTITCWVPKTNYIFNVKILDFLFLMLKVFFILIGANVKYKIKWKVKPGFAIGLHKKDIDLLKKN